MKRSGRGAAAVLAAGALPIFACAAIADVEPIAYQSANQDAASDGAPGADTSVSAPPDAGDDALLCNDDEDGDGVTSEACGGADCDDTDPLTHPGADFVDVTPPAGKNGDWNCDGVVTKQFSENLDCSSFTADECATHLGYTTKATCGDLLTFVACFVSQGACLARVEGLRKQGCK